PTAHVQIITPSRHTRRFITRVRNRNSRIVEMKSYNAVWCTPTPWARTCKPDGSVSTADLCDTVSTWLFTSCSRQTFVLQSKFDRRPPSYWNARNELVGFPR